MGRSSKLSPGQWLEIEKRLLHGESPADLAKEAGVHRSQITRRFSQQLQKIKNVANQIVAANESLSELPVAQQVAAVSFAQSLASTSSKLATAAELSAGTASMLALLAHSKMKEVADSPKPLERADEIKTVGVLSSLANEASKIPLNLLAANKGIPGTTEPPPAKSLSEFYATLSAEPEPSPS